MNINPEIPKTLRQFNINEADGILCLLALYYNLNETIIPPIVSKQVSLSKIVERDIDHPGKIIWNIALYENEVIPQDKEWEWVENFRKAFGKLRADAIGNKKNCYDKMKKFFSQNPEIRVDDIKEALNMYLKPFELGRQDVKYLQQADYFISKRVKAEGGTEYSSRLEMYLEIIKKQKAEQQSSGNNTDKYQRQIVR